MAEERIIDKIRKLLNLANNEGATEGERDNALRMAYNLIAKHNLDLAEIEKRGQPEQRTDSKGTYYGRPWAITVNLAMAELFFCRYYSQDSAERNMRIHHFVGKLSNSVTAFEMSQFLIASIRKESGKRMRELGESNTWRRSFCVGAANKLYERVLEMINQKQEEVKSTGTSLVVADYYKQEEEANASWLESQGVRLVKRASRAGGTLLSGVGAGRSYGAGLPLNIQTTHKNPTLIK